MSQEGVFLPADVFAELPKFARDSIISTMGKHGKDVPEELLFGDLSAPTHEDALDFVLKALDYTGDKTVWIGRCKRIFSLLPEASTSNEKTLLTAYAHIIVAHDLGFLSEVLDAAPIPKGRHLVPEELRNSFYESSKGTSLPDFMFHLSLPEMLILSGFDDEAKSICKRFRCKMLPGGVIQTKDGSFSNRLSTFEKIASMVSHDETGTRKLLVALSMTKTEDIAHNAAIKRKLDAAPVSILERVASICDEFHASIGETVMERPDLLSAVPVERRGEFESSLLALTHGKHGTRSPTRTL